jgi:RND family efflux transporter MFP subunit
MRRYRTQQRDRIAALSAAKAVEPRLVDEKEDEVEASIAAELAAEAGVATAEAKVSAAEASVVQARADLVAAEAKVEVAQAALDRASVFLAYTKIVSPYDGVVTRRSFFRGAFVRAAEQGGLIPLLSVSRTDLMRVVAQVPDRDVPLVSVGNVAKVNIDALPGEEFEGKVARMADSEDPVTRTMRVEVDLPNPHNKLREGMYGLVAIHLDSGKKLLTIPSSCLVGNVENDKGTVFVVENNVARSRPVIVGSDSGLSTDVISGLSELDEVISRHSGALADGATVEATKSER